MSAMTMLSGRGGDAAESGRQQHRVYGRQQRAASTTVQPDVESRPSRLTIDAVMSSRVRPLRTMSPQRPLSGQRYVTTTTEYSCTSHSLQYWCKNGLDKFS